MPTYILQRGSTVDTAIHPGAGFLGLIEAKHPAAARKIAEAAGQWEEGYFITLLNPAYRRTLLAADREALAALPTITAPPLPPCVSCGEATERIRNLGGNSWQLACLNPLCGKLQCDPPRKNGRPTLGDKPMTPNEKNRRAYHRNKKAKV